MSDEIKQIQAQIEKLERRLLELTEPVTIYIHGRKMKIAGRSKIGGKYENRMWKRVVPLLIVREKGK